MSSWNDSYKLNINEIDSQHKILFDIFDELIAAMSVGQAREKVSTILMKLDNYARTHFANEEKYMKRFNYPDAKDHLEAHQFFYSKMSDFKSMLNSAMSIDIMSFLKKWFVNHIQITDKKYVPMFQSNGVK